MRMTIANTPWLFGLHGFQGLIPKSSWAIPVSPPNEIATRRNAIDASIGNRKI
jgi:hypothetical protein